MAQTESIRSLKEFLEECPVGTSVTVSCTTQYTAESTQTLLVFEPIESFCGHPRCKRRMWFDVESPAIGKVNISAGASKFIATYVCRHCTKRTRDFAISASGITESLQAGRTATLLKIGEQPPGGEPMPARLLELAKGDRELWLKGRRCENQSLGVAAYAYYRRVIERQRDQLFDKMIQVCKAVDPSSELVGQLERAKKETQFTKALELIRVAVPQALLIQGHNPLRLLHDALSDGIHNRSDEECLELARVIRTLMAKTTELMHAALAEDTEVAEALKKLVNAKQPKVRKPIADDDAGRPSDAE